MPSNRGSRLTKRTVDAIRPSGTDAVHWDSQLTGFGLRVRRSGRKSYVVQTRVDGRLRWFTIGRHGPLTPDGARAKALEILADARKGIDPRAARTRRGTDPTMADLCKRFLEEHVRSHCKPATQRDTNAW